MLGDAHTPVSHSRGGCSLRGWSCEPQVDPGTEQITSSTFKRAFRGLLADSITAFRKASQAISHQRCKPSEQCFFGITQCPNQLISRSGEAGQVQDWPGIEKHLVAVEGCLGHSSVSVLPYAFVPLGLLTVAYMGIGKLARPFGGLWLFPLVYRGSGPGVGERIRVL